MPEREIRIEWSNPRKCTVYIEADYLIRWDVTLSVDGLTRATNSTAGWIPDRWWSNDALLRAFSKVGNLLMGCGRINLTGKVPNGQRFVSKPKIIWPVESCQAEVCGLKLGPAGPLPGKDSLSNIWLPQHELFFVGNLHMESFDPARHRTTLSRYPENPEKRVCYTKRIKCTSDLGSTQIAIFHTKF